MRTPATHNYVLVGKEVVPEDDYLKWAFWFEHHTKERQVRHTDLYGQSLVSTVFIGVSFDDPPLVFETMIFRVNDESVTTGRYATWEEAECGHEIAAERERAYHQNHSCKRPD